MTDPSSAFGQQMSGGPFGQMAQAMGPGGLSASQVQSGIGPGMSDFLSFSQYGRSPIASMGGAYPGISSGSNPMQAQMGRRFGYMQPLMEAPLYGPQMVGSPMVGSPMVGPPMVGPPMIGAPIMGSPYYPPRMPYGNPYMYDSFSPVLPVY